MGAAPALDVVRYEEVEFQNLFDEPSIYRGPPTAEREQAWQDLWERESSRLRKHGGF